MKLNTQTVTQESLFSELSDEGNMESLLQITASRKYYLNFKIWHNLYIILSSWIWLFSPVFFIIQESGFTN